MHAKTPKTPNRQKSLTAKNPKNPAKNSRATKISATTKTKIL
jgi:hypothetical protein